METKNIIIFTDGSCIKTKIKNYGGYGIFFPNKKFENFAATFLLEPKTNQRAELYAIYQAVNTINDNLSDYNVHIHTDSMYAINTLTVWINKWKNNMWKTSNKKPVKNLDIIKPTYDIINNGNNNYSFYHVYAHTKAEDFNSQSNSVADKLATTGTKLGM